MSLLEDAAGVVVELLVAPADCVELAVAAWSVPVVVLELLAAVVVELSELWLVLVTSACGCVAVAVAALTSLTDWVLASS